MCKKNQTSLLKPKANTNKLSTKKKAKKIVPYKYFDEYKDLFTGEMIPIPTSFLDRLCTDLMQWALNDPKALVVDKFWFDHGIGQKTAWRWRQKYKPLQEAYYNATQAVGIRREEGALLRKLDSNIVSRTASHYRAEWRELEEWRSDLRQKADEKTQISNIKWVMEKFPESKEVPTIKIEDDD